jgi:hypothetical protein
VTAPEQPLSYACLQAVGHCNSAQPVPVNLTRQQGAETAEEISKIQIYVEILLHKISAALGLFVKSLK